MTRFRRGDIVTHKLLPNAEFVVLRRVLLPLGGYLVRGSYRSRDGYNMMFSRLRFRACEIQLRSQREE